MLLLTDGEIFDMDKTVDLVIEASELPCSIVIVGVGDEEFEKMEALDADKGRLRSKDGREAKRDIVQFVKFNEAVKRGDLAAQVLKEIPRQLVSYMKSIGFFP